MRILLTSACVTTAAAAVLLAAPAAYADPPGDNGTVKIHDATTGEALKKNEPHVCTFYLDAFTFDGAQEVTWKIAGMPPTDRSRMVAETGALTLDADGHGRTGDLHLKDGHYKLFWNFDGEHGKAKHKVFWVDCEGGQGDENGGGPGTEPSGSTSPGAEVSQPASPAPSSPAAGSSSPAAAVPPSAPSPNGGSGDLAETGSSAPTGAIAGAAALLLGAGAYLTLRHRNARTQKH